ncbi:MAG: TatD family hydrolase [Chloroflexi bacterium]|nr:TatD family hydrolase [Chloroflexota bacterium]
MLCDSHAHLDDEAFSYDLDSVVGRAQESGLKYIVCPGTDIKSSKRCLEIALQYPDVIIPAAGVHPHEAKSWNEKAEAALEDIISSCRVKAIGEIGLDYHYDFSPRNVQMEVFRRQIRLAVKYRLPLICHLREAESDFIKILSEEALPSPPGVIHCYSSGPDYVDEFLSRGFYIGFTGVITFKKADRVKQALGKVPLDRLLIETDSPYMAPVPYRGKRCEPAHAVLTARAAADIKGISYDELAAHTTANLLEMLKMEQQ